MRETARMMAMNPYPGFKGKFFSMPCRNVVPKPVQRPHPPLWVACSNRDTIQLAARLGIGALTFAFIDPAEAKYWVDEYYTTFKNECAPIGRAVNPNIAMVTGFMCHEDSETAVAPGPRRLPVLRLRARPLLHHRHARAGPHEHLGGLQERAPVPDDADRRHRQPRRGARRTWRSSRRSASIR